MRVPIESIQKLKLSDGNTVWKTYCPICGRMLIIRDIESDQIWCGMVGSGCGEEIEIVFGEETL